MNQKNIRYIIQTIFFLLVAWISINHSILGAGISLHGICPFGGVETLYTYITDATFVKRIHLSSLLLMYTVIALSLILGPVFCGWVCPLGSLQELIGKLGKRLFKSKYNNFVPSKSDHFLRYLRIFVLLWVLYVTAKAGTLVFQDLDPFYALFQFYTGEVAISALIILMLTLISSLFIERPWCKYLCPYGAFLGFFNKLRIFKIKRNETTCISCHKCNTACPMNIDVESVDKVSDLQCISCLECTSDVNCPIDNTVVLKIGGF